MKIIEILKAMSRRSRIGEASNIHLVTVRTALAEVGY